MNMYYFQTFKTSQLTKMTNLSTSQDIHKPKWLQLPSA